MNWIVQSIRDSIWQFFADLATDIINEAFGLVTEAIIKTSDLNAYINLNKYIEYVQIIAGALLVTTVAWEAFKQLSGKMIPAEEKSFGTQVLQTVWAGFLIYFLPESIDTIFLRANNALIRLIQYIGVEISTDKFADYMSLSQGLITLGSLMIFMMLILGLAFLALGIVAGIRYIELVVTTVISPIVAVSAVRGGEGLSVWVRETIAIVFTQSIHFLLLQLLLAIMAKVTGIMMVVLSVSVIAVMIRGPQILRKYLYSSGTGSAGVSTAGQAGRMATMKYMFTK